MKTIDVGRLEEFEAAAGFLLGPPGFSAEKVDELAEQRYVAGTSRAPEDLVRGHRYR